jgi:hydrogenase maturation protein HypF
MHSPIAFRIHLEGLVQGVGFRPFVYRLASRYGLYGWVVNQTDGLTIKVEGPAQAFAGFMEALRAEAPVISRIEEIAVEPDEPEGLNGFLILASQDMTNETSEISPDIAVCDACLADMKTQPHRIAYPFVNCTNCGPRFSIIRDFPYDRAKTTMAPFVMCATCHDEYEDILDRRFHAQPVACKNCGPAYTLHQDRSTFNILPVILERTVHLVRSGAIVAVKGVGGFHLMCDAFDGAAVNRLRSSKRREGKPFAVMFRDLECIEKYAVLSEEERSALLSWRRPIVIVETRKDLAEGVSRNLGTLGVFLPYMPWHTLFFEQSALEAVVLTSGNLAEEPILISNATALEQLSPIAGGIVTYNRDIFNRTDDSVVRVMGGAERIFRRSRGYVPTPVKLTFDATGIFAAGAELSACFCMGKGNRAYLSQHIGDLKNEETLAFYEETAERFRRMFRIEPVLAVTDLHPDYLSTRFAAALQLETLAVQHHHAHVAACMAENGLEEPVIGLAFDGTGYGTDGHTWGSEFLVCEGETYTRMAHFQYMAMPGGDLAAEEPWRMGISLLHQAYGREWQEVDLPWLRQVDRNKAEALTRALEQQINCPHSSGLGRLFDGVAAITGCCVHSLFHAEAPMRLEAMADPAETGRYETDLATLSVIPMIRQICEDLRSGVPVPVIAARFHNTLTWTACVTVQRLSRETGIDKVVLSGGSFQNKILFESILNTLEKEHFTVYTHKQVPCNDGGLALGQLAVAGWRRR